MKRLYATLAALLLTGPALAAEPATGFYFGAGVGNAKLTLEDSDSPADFEADDTGWRIIAGYRVLRYLAVEANYADYGSAEDTVIGTRLRGDFSAFHVAAVGILPLRSVDLFGKAGVAAWEGTLRNDFGGEDSEDNVDPIIGLGAQLHAGQLAVRAEIEGLLLGFDDDNDDEADGDDSIAFYSVSLTWNF